MVYYSALKRKSWTGQACGMELLLLIVPLALLCGGGEREDTAMPAHCKHGGHAQGAGREADSEVRMVCSSRELVWVLPQIP